MAWFSENDTKPLDGGNYVLNILNYINELNESFSAEQLKCLEQELHQDENKRQEEQECEVNWDTILCWPRTLAGTLATIPCFDELNGIPYDTTQNASRWCWPNGTWSSYSNYSLCRDLRLLTVEPEVETTTTLYFIGYSLSLSFLIVAVFIFHFTGLRGLRNHIHKNLMFTYILTDLMWILTTMVLKVTNKPICVTFFSLLHYFHLTNFFWMFVEGLYLYLLVVKAFNVENIKLRFFIMIGWGIPLLVIATWAIAKSLDQDATSQANQEVALFWRHCPWMIPHSYDWFYKAPAIAVLVINVMILCTIMWVIMTKLWSPHNVETQQYRKASKALLVLIPLLGVTYVLVIAGPTEGQAGNAFSYVRALMLSLQGFVVAVFYCFLNTEVQNAIKHQISQWSAARNLDSRRRYYNNWSPRSRTESIRLNQPSNPYQKRESTVSDTTTTIVIDPNSTTTFFDKSKKVISENLNE
ncbi:hypothetical protein DMN91_009157 [Ooceraea biroi]|uniref:Diuretic hormone receptor n=1 Tax=Ooceraea biroi TaxID=2015173 RepID=A0A026WN54_OOCBI|nr:diuretic hormone receptor isoform X2 [Ooceraea biroi]EZA57388.1 Diuretic hormone receptor [Ooceraea biroi]RLU18800.1 hypothetical protein DMN91_009157 [Ooceraea biroi]